MARTKKKEVVINDDSFEEEIKHEFSPRVAAITIMGFLLIFILYLLLTGAFWM